MKKLMINSNAIASGIYLIRGKKVMLDRDLAILYGVKTEHLKRQVRRNFYRFPADFMFELSKEETEKWRCQFGISNPGYKMGLRHSPFAFTEHGILMLSSVLNSRKAAEVNIAIMRVFLQLREMILTNREFALYLQRLEKTVMYHGNEIQKLVRKVSHLTEVKGKPKRRIGFHA